MTEALSSPSQPQPVPRPEAKPPYTKADWERDLAAAPFRTAAEHSGVWVEGTAAIEPEDEVGRAKAHELLETQIIHGFNLGRKVDDGAGGTRIELDQEGRDLVNERMRLLGGLATDDLDPDNRRKALDLARDFGYLVWKDAEVGYEAFKLHRLATTDPLTGLRNRNGMAEVLPGMIASAEKGETEGLALFFVDVDRFKLANDTLGHNRGDELLTGLARVIMHKTRTRYPGGGRATDIVVRPHQKDEPEEGAAEQEQAGRQAPRELEPLVYEGEVLPKAKPPVGAETAEAGDQPDDADELTVRYGGDEFIVAAQYSRHKETHPTHGLPKSPFPTQLERTEAIAARISNECNDFLRRQTGGEIPGLGVSVGYTIWEPGMTVEDVIRAADQHMYTVKERRKEAAIREELEKQTAAGVSGGAIVVDIPGRHPVPEVRARAYRRPSGLAPEVPPVHPASEDPTQSSS